jgi:hypothetical protein
MSLNCYEIQFLKIIYRNKYSFQEIFSSDKFFLRKLRNYYNFILLTNMIITGKLLRLEDFSIQISEEKKNFSS